MTAVLGVFLARMIGGYALCLAAVGPLVTEGSWRRVSLIVIAGLCAVALACGVPAVACIGVGLGAVLLERAITFRVPILGSPLWMAPLGAWIMLAAEYPPTLATFPSGIAVGGTLGAMLLGHSYLTARGLSFAPLKRMAFILFGILLLRTLFVLPAFFGDALQMMDMVFLAMRCALGLFLPLVLGWMVLQCVKIESNQSATGILYAMTLLVGVFGELVAVYLQLNRGIAA